MPSDNRRPRRVAEAIRSTVAEAMTSVLNDPGLSGLVVTDVNVSDDLSQARIGVRRLVDDGQEASRRRLIERLTHAQGRLRGLLGPRLDLRRVPMLHFYFDAGPDKRHRVDELLREIEQENKSKTSNTEGSNTPNSNGNES
jgi:ribosome-binding factor A